MTPKEVLKKAAELIESASMGGDDVRRFALVIHDILLDATTKIEDFLSGVTTENDDPARSRRTDSVADVTGIIQTYPLKKRGRPKGSKNKKPERPKTMSGEATPGGLMAPCEICGCTWTNPCPEGCSWSQDYTTAGRYVCSSAMCRKRAYDADVAYLMRTGNPGGYCGPVSAEQLLAEQKSTELKS